MIIDPASLKAAKAAVLADLRGRKLLKWLFREDADTDCHPIGYVDGPIDEATQDEIAESLARTVLKVQEMEIERLIGALTPSAETKAAYMGEFSMRFPEFDADGEEYMRSINVPWTTIKEIMAAIRAYAALDKKA